MYNHDAVPNRQYKIEFCQAVLMCFPTQDCRACQGTTCLIAVRWPWACASLPTVAHSSPSSCGLGLQCVPTFLDILSTQRCWCMEDQSTLPCPCQPPALLYFPQETSPWADKSWTSTPSSYKNLLQKWILKNSYDQDRDLRLVCLWGLPSKYYLLACCKNWSVPS